MADQENDKNEEPDSSKVSDENSAKEDSADKKQLTINIDYTRVPQLATQCFISFTSAFQLKSGLHPLLQEQETLNGFTGKSFRHLLNNLCKIDSGVYLEVGTFCGSSLISALYGNHDRIKKAYAIDNWSEFRDHCDPKERFNLHRESYIPQWGDDKLKIIEGDCFSLDLSEIDEKVDIYFYDGAHEYEDHKKAFTYFDPVLKHQFVTLIDDWEKQKVQEATYDAFSELGYSILAKYEVLPPADRENRMENPDMNWWHGVAMFLIQKKSNE